jgi:hypothetical protein
VKKEEGLWLVCEFFSHVYCLYDLCVCVCARESEERNGCGWCVNSSVDLCVCVRERE